MSDLLLFYFPPVMFFFSVLPLAVYMTILFLVALWKRDNSVADIGYGIGFIVMLILPYIGTILFFSQKTVVQCIPFLLVCIWGVRLSLRIYLKHKGKPEDFRYASWRSEWKWVRTRSFFQVFALQGVIISLIAFPVLPLAYSFVFDYSTTLFVIGFLVWVKGFLFEVIADYQLDMFMKHSENKGLLMTSGLWQYSRHPNYFGEAVMWWGIWIITTAIVPEIWYLTIISPLLITFLLTKVSGVPLLEVRMSQYKDWQAYKNKTSVFIPWFPKKITSQSE